MNKPLSAVTWRTIIISTLFAAVFVSIGGVARAELPYQTMWTRQMGTAGGDFGSGLTTDLQGNVYVAGYTGGGIDGNVSAGGNDLFVVKYDSAGVKQWARQLGTATSDIAYGVGVDGSGNAYVAGYTFGGLDGNVSAGGYDLFVVKFDSAGVKQWTRQMGTPVNDIVYGVSVDGAGNSYMVGYTQGGLDGNVNAGGLDLFMVKYDPAGVKQWTRQMGTSVDDIAFGVSVGGSGNVYVSGATAGGLDGNTSAGGYDLIVVKFDSAGVKLWTRQLGTAYDEGVVGISVDSMGNVHVAGGTYGSIDGNVSAGSSDPFVVKYDSAGVKQWTRQIGTGSWDSANGVSVDALGNVYVAGGTDSTIDGNVSAGSQDLFVIKYDSAGVKQWTRQVGTPYQDFANAAAVDGSGSVFATGFVFGGLDGNVSAGGADMYLIRLVPDPFSFITAPLDGALLAGGSFNITGDTLATNGVAFVEVSTDGATWQTASGTSPWGLAWSIPADGAYSIRSRATDTLANVEPDHAGVDVTVGTLPLAIDSLVADPASPQAAGTPVVWTATASGGSGSYMFRYWRMGPDTKGKFKSAQPWGPSSEFAWTPAASQAGLNTIKVSVKDVLLGGKGVEAVQEFMVQ